MFTLITWIGEFGSSTVTGFASAEGALDAGLDRGFRGDYGCRKDLVVEIINAATKESVVRTSLRLPCAERAVAA